MDTNLISSLIDEKVFGVWFLIGAALVFWMQAGFAMVECGFARAKNAGNIIMKNLMDWLRESEERRQYHHEEPDGFLYWYSSICCNRLRFVPR